MQILDKDSLFEFLTNNSRYRIWKETGISQKTLSNYATGITPIGRMSLDNAIKLTEYARKLEEQ